MGASGRGASTAARGGSASRARLRFALSVLIWLALWQVVAALANQPLLLPGPWQTLVAFVGLAGSGTFWATVGASFATIAIAFIGAFLVALVLGALAASHPVLADLIHPLALVVKATPVACIVVVLLLWLGAEGVPVAAVALVVFPAYYFSTLEGVRQVDPGLADALRVMGVGPGRLWLAHTWPSVVPYLVATSKNAVGMAWKAGVAAELISMALNTLGEKVYQAKLLLETPELFAWTLTIILCAFACEKAFLWLLARSGSASLSLAVRSAPREPARSVVDEDSRITVLDLTIERGGKRILSNLSFRVEGGEAICLRGPSGEGKTSLLLALMGLVPVESGIIKRPARLSAVFQEARLVETLSMEDNVRLVACGVPREDVRAALDALLPGVERERLARDLSGGQRRRLELARALLCPSAAVLLDEPFAGLDEQARKRAIAFIAERLGGRSLVISTHNEDDGDELGAVCLRL